MVMAGPMPIRLAPIATTCCGRRGRERTPLYRDGYGVSERFPPFIAVVIFGPPGFVNVDHALFERRSIFGRAFNRPPTGFLPFALKACKDATDLFRPLCPIGV